MISPAQAILDDILAKARQQGLDQRSLAQKAGVAPETISRTKKRGTMDLAILTRLADAVGGDLQFVPQAAPQAAPPLNSTSRGLSWSNPAAPQSVLLRKAIRSGQFHNLLQAALEVGLPLLRAEVAAMQQFGPEGGDRPLTSAQADEIEHRLRNIERGLAAANVAKAT